MVLRKMGNSVSPTVHLDKNGDEYSFHTVSTFKTTVIKFKLGEEFEEETLDGRKVKSTITLSGNTLNQTQKTEKTSTIVREFGDNELVVTCTYGDCVSKRWYKAVA
jgi:fatty acid-binding protein 3, muscle and heart